MTGVVAGLLRLTPDGPDAFRGPHNGPVGKRAYGGLLAGQALAAACRTVPADRVPTSLHVQFLRGGDAAGPFAPNFTARGGGTAGLGEERKCRREA